MDIRIFITLSAFLFQSCRNEVCDPSRRIVDGQIAKLDRPYMVYLIKTDKASVRYVGWLCGGVIVSADFVLTSAACIEDVKFMYVVAGTMSYVSFERLSSNQCAHYMKKKIIYTCIPKNYDFDYEDVYRWASNDIALVKVESPYDFYDHTYLEHKCDWIPQKININFKLKYQTANTDAIVMGWGHTIKYRIEDDLGDYNEKCLRETSVLIIDKARCKKMWGGGSWSAIIDKYMVCTDGPGSLNSEGEPPGIIVDELVEECVEEPDRLKLSNTKDCVDGDPTRRKFIVHSARDHHNVTRRQGFCQNDHGGPLVGWVGGKETVLGVASACRFDGNRECIGPFLYTSTYCHGIFLYCIINGNMTSVGRSQANRRCSSEMRSGVTHIETVISWADHPDGPSENEVIAMRPIKPISKRSDDSPFEMTADNPWSEEDTINRTSAV